MPGRTWRGEVQRWTLAGWVALSLGVACDGGAPAATECVLRWECGVDIYTVDCDVTAGGADSCVCERNESRTGSCERSGICADAAAYHEEGADRAQLELNLRSNTVSCCGYSVSTESSRCALRVE